MRPRWVILGLLLAGITYGTMIWWPEAPLWSRSRGTTYVLAFSKDSKTIFFLDEKRKNPIEPIRLHLGQWDATTGTLLREVPIAVPELFEVRGIGISGDGTALLISGNVPPKSGRASNMLYVFETSSGLRRLGPIACSHGQPKFSPIGRWIVYNAVDENPIEHGIEVINSETGNKALSVSSTGDESVRSTCFSPDDSSIAILLHDRQNNYSIRIFDLTSGKERDHFTLPKALWRHLKSWRNSFLTAAQESPPGPEQITKIFTIDLESNPIGQVIERPDMELRQSKSKSGKPVSNWYEYASANDWRAEIRFEDNDDLGWLREYWNKCLDWFGINKVPEARSQYRLRFIDLDSNRIRYQSPLFIDTFVPFIAESGAIYAVQNKSGELSVRSAQPWPRYPWALAASLSLLSIVLLIGRWRASRAHLFQLRKIEALTRSQDTCSRSPS